MIRVLVVDDSAVAQELLCEILRNAGDLEVIGVASNGADAVRQARELQPDVITMDVHMPRMDGYAATAEIMTSHPTPIVVVSGSRGHDDIEKSVQALAAGALTVVAKPPAPRSENFADAAQRLVQTVRSMSQVRVIRRHPSRPALAASASAFPEIAAVPPPRLITIAASTGGPQAINRLLRQLPANFSVPIVIVQHISEGFTAGLAEWLDGDLDASVSVAQDGESLLAAHVYLAPEGAHCGVTRSGHIRLSDRPPLAGFRPSATALFESASQAFGNSHVAVILTGMGTDGVDGLRCVRQSGGLVLAQSEESCVVYGMPRAAVDAGLAHIVVGPAELGRQLVRLACRPHEPD